MFKPAFALALATLCFHHGMAQPAKIEGKTTVIKLEPGEVWALQAES